jgi:hypothetical protein
VDNVPNTDVGKGQFKLRKPRTTWKMHKYYGRKGTGQVLKPETYVDNVPNTAIGEEQCKVR